MFLELFLLKNLIKNPKLKNSPMSLKVGIISGGAFGTAIALSIADELKAVKGYNDTLTILVRDESFNDVKVVDLFNVYKENKMYLPNINLKENIRATTDFNEIMDWDIVFFATPQEHFISVCKKIKVKNTALLISLTKGLLDNRLTTPCSFLKKKYNASVFALMGANLASEIAENQPTQSTLGYAPEDKDLAHKIIKPLFKNIKIEPFPSFLGVEYCGTFKNVVATIYGVALGLNLGGNLRSAIFSQGVKELKHFLSLHNLGEDLIFYSCGIQDLFVTCLHGRNKDCGYKIGISHDIKDYTCQGINSCHFYYEYLKSTGKINEFPLVKLLYMIITKKEKDFKKAICELFE